MKVCKPKLLHHITDGVIEGDGVVCYQKKLKEVRHLYNDQLAITKEDENECAYTVYSYGAGDLNEPGNLFWGLTILHPLEVDGECNMTRGHFHENRQCVEYYFGISGNGLLLLMDEEGKTWAEEIYKDSLHYIPGNIAHRIVNVGDVDLKVGACWPTTAGHDYTAIESKEFGYRVYRSDNKIKFQKR